MEITLPKTSLVVLIGPSGAGKSTFAARHFGPHEVVSSDQCRAMISDDANDQSVTSDAFALAHTLLAMRLKHDRLAVLDATSVQRESRAPLLELARAHDCMAVAIVLDMPEAVCVERNSARADRSFGAKVIQRQKRDLRRSLRALQREGFRRVFVLRDPEQVAQVTITREPLWVDQRQVKGPFDIIGDVHGCFDELRALLHKLDYTLTPTDDPAQPWQVTPPPGRRAIFLGDLVDRGPQTPQVLALVMSMVQDGAALCVAGNHDVKLARALQGKKVTLRHGLAESMAQLEATSPEQRQQIMRFLDGLISHYMLDGGALCVAHAGLTQDYQGRASGRVRQLALYGDTDGEVDSFGLPVRHDWAASYRGEAMVIYGHTPTPEARWVNNTMCIDTGCVFGGKLTALRYPEREVVSVDAARVYAEPVRPLLPPDERALNPQQASDTLLDLEDIQGKRLIETTLLGKIMIPPDQASAALEVMSRYAVDPRWLIYLPPTMSPCATSQREGVLEHPDEAFDSYAGWGVSHVICQQKHMGSRAILIVTRTPEVAITRFGLDAPGHGVIVTRTGRPFFSDDATRDALLSVTRDALTRAGLWDSLNTDWVCLDAELMPWSAKAMSLLQHQYAATGAAARAHASASLHALERAAARGVSLPDALLERARARQAMIDDFSDAYRHYCWEVNALTDYKIAPFHLLASEGATHLSRDHAWHMQQLAALAEADPTGILMATEHRIVDLNAPSAREEATAWWRALVEAGGEGMVIKPLELITYHKGKLVQPALKCRGASYLRLIYGPEYTRPEHLERLRKRSLHRKRALALRELALGAQALDLFVARAPLRQVHACVFGVLASESEPIDPRL